MPSRWVCLVIIALWLVTMGLLFQREIWPYLQPNTPPPYTIDLVDEARQQHQAQIRWSVYVDGDRPTPRPPEIRASSMVGLLGLGQALNPGSLALAPHLFHITNQWQPFLARTWVEYRERPDDTFAFHMKLTAGLGGKRHLNLGTIKLERMNSLYRVNRLGQLKEMEVDFLFDAIVDLPLFGRIPIRDTEVSLSGQVSDDKFRASYKVHPPRGLALPADLCKLFEGETEAVTLSHNGSILLPLHPVNRIQGLRPGQKWRMPMVNPVEEALARSLLPGRDKPRFLNAEVLRKPQQLPDHEERISCLVIEYDDKELRPRTFVQEGSGLVLRQEASISTGQRLILQRESIPREP